jgi:uncharacterized protein with PIN domain
LCKALSSVKDTIEAIGVPHVEVSKIILNGSEKDFHYLLQPNDRIEVLPYENHFPDEAPKSFVLDVHLGGLSRLLRMLGIDTIYQNNFHDREIVATAVYENRAVLTRDIGLLKHKVLKWGYWLRSQQSEEQLVEVVKHFTLCPVLRPFSRCMACNGQIQKVEKNDLLHLLHTQTRETFDEIFQCSQCGKVYWKGSHYDKMELLVQRIQSIAC